MPNFSLLAWGFVVLGILGTLSGISWRIYDSGRDAVYLEWEQANAKRREADAKRAAAASGGLEADRGKRRVVYRTITQLVDKIVDRPVYRSDCVDDAGLQLINAGLAGERPAAGESNGGVPPAQPPSRQNRSGTGEEAAGGK